MNRIFILSPARTSGERADLIYNPGARFDLARRLHRGEALPIHEIFTFLSGLYFRGKVAYAKTFAAPRGRLAGTFVITSNQGLMDINQTVTLDELRAFSTSEIDLKNEAYIGPLERDAKRISRKLGRNAEVVLLGSISTKKYVDPLLKIFGERLRFPIEFVGRGDMSRGSLLLRHAVAKTELTYAPLGGATLRGKRPPRLEPRRWNSQELRVWFDSCVKAANG